LELLDFVALAAVFVFAFLGGHIAQWRRQSVIVGYILAGVALGTLAAYYGPLGSGLFEDVDARQLTRPVQVIFDFGITFLMFFIGMEISLKRLSRAGRSATIVAITDTGFNLFAGVLIGTLMGWGWRDIFFLSGIILMSSLSVAAKALIELRRLDNRETEFLLSAMVVEAFIAMVLLTLSTSVIVVSDDAGFSGGLSEIAIAVVIVYATLFLIAMFLVPRMAKRMESIRHEEVFILLVLAMIFSAAALSWTFGLPFMIGAFFMGIAFSETALTERLRTRLMSLRDAFTAAFFIAFGMMIDLGDLFQTETLIIVSLAILFIVVNEMLFTATISFFMGLNRREVVNMGAALLGRGEDAILFASVGGGLKDANGAHLLPQGMKLYPFAGGLSLIMTLVTPKVMVISPKIGDKLAASLPPWLRFGGVLIQRTMAVELAPDASQRYGHAGAVGVSLILFFASILGLVITFQPKDLDIHLIILGLGLVMWVLLSLSIRSRFRHLAEHIKLTGLDLLVKDRRILVDYVSRTLSVLLLLGLLIVAVSPISIPLSMVFPPIFISIVLVLSKRVHDQTVGPPSHMTGMEMLEQQARVSGKRLRRRRKDPKW
jgi:CPA2 family monovalent cation:H+ antiporter-2